MRNMLKRKTKFLLSALLSVSFLLTGCTPEEKTLLLPMITSSGEESEEADSAKDFTVKKIYTYTYETDDSLGKSAFLQNCGENELLILARNEEGPEGSLVYRQVDYRYGFYDTLGQFQPFWDFWFHPSEEESKEDIYLDRMIPSPDGSQLLLYVRSAFWNTYFVWLYSMDSQEPLLLYEGSPHANPPDKNSSDTEVKLLGSFSESGRWVTFDAAGATCEDEYYIPIFDCQKAHSDGREPAQDTAEDTELSYVYPPDQKLYAPKVDMDSLYTAMLYDRPDSAGLICFGRDSNGLFVTQDYSEPPNASEADMSKAYSYPCVHKGTILEEDGRMRYLHYRYHLKENSIYYLETPISLSCKDMATLETVDRHQDFPNLVWDFLPLDSGDLLAVLVQEQKAEEMMSATGMNIDTYIFSETSFLTAVQDYWNILSADLYLYPEGETEGHLLYKNLQNLISIEYDAANRRILLETSEGQFSSRRKCIILEL